MGLHLPSLWPGWVARAASHGAQWGSAIGPLFLCLLTSLRTGQCTHTVFPAAAGHWLHEVKGSQGPGKTQQSLRFSL